MNIKEFIPQVLSFVTLYKLKYNKLSNKHYKVKLYIMH